MNEWLSLIFGGFISKVINDGIDTTKRMIKSVVDDRNNRNFSTKIYRVIEKTLDEFMEKFCARICKNEELRNMISLILQKLGFEKSEEISQMIIKAFEDNHKEHDTMLKKIDAIPQNV